MLQNSAKCKLAKCLKLFAICWQNSSKILEKHRKTRDFRAVQRSSLCRSRRELSNAYLLAKFRFDTAENEPCKVSRIPRLPHRGFRTRSGLRSSSTRTAPRARDPTPLSGSDQHLRRARSRLYRSEILQENMRLKALAEIYKMHSFALL